MRLYYHHTLFTIVYAARNKISSQNIMCNGIYFVACSICNANTHIQSCNLFWCYSLTTIASSCHTLPLRAPSTRYTQRLPDLYMHNLRIFIKHNLFLYTILFATKLLVSMRVRDECAPQGASIYMGSGGFCVESTSRSSGMLMSGNASDYISFSKSRTENHMRCLVVFE